MSSESLYEERDRRGKEIVHDWNSVRDLCEIE